jgi:hypothetical protein
MIKGSSMVLPAPGPTIRTTTEISPKLARKDVTVRKVRWKGWLAVFVGLLLLEAMSIWLLPRLGLNLLASIVGIGSSSLAYAWIMIGLFRLKQYRLARHVRAIILSGTAVGGVAYLVSGAGYIASFAVVSIWAMVVGFIVGLSLIKLILSTSSPITGVARTVIDEAIRMKVALVFIIGMILMVPILPLVLDTTERLEYRLQFFLNWSIGGLSILLSLLTVFLACSTICAEISDRQIFLTMSKPVTRVEYLLGKWLGISLLNLLLLVVGGCGVYLMTGIVRNGPNQGFSDVLAVREEVLAARVAVRPEPPDPDSINTLYQQRLKELIREDPEVYEGELSEKARAAIRTSLLVKWHTIAPYAEQTFIFSGVDRAVRLVQDTQPRDKDGKRVLPPNAMVQLRIKPRHGRPASDNMIRMALWLNGRPYPYDQRTGLHMPTVLSTDNFHVLNLPLAAVDDEGRITVRIQNVNLMMPQATHPYSISFAPDSGIELLYRVGWFEGNLTRALSMLWVRLVFLGALGLFAGTFLGFNVAALLSLLIYGVSMASGYLVEALNDYAGLGGGGMSFFELIGGLLQNLGTTVRDGNVEVSIKVMMRILGEIVVSSVPYFGGYNPVPMLADGRHIETAMIVESALKIGLGWGGGCAVMAWWVFRKRELARITV